MPFKLISTEGDQAFELKGAATLVVGRALNSDIPVFDPTISRRHAELTVGADGVQVRDLGSSNGTFLNGSAVTEGRAAAGDVVTFGKVAFHLRETPADRASGAVVQAPTPSSREPALPRMAGTIVRQLNLQELGGLAGVQAGAGIVYDSVPAREWEETENKARAMLTAIGWVRGPGAASREPG